MKFIVVTHPNVHYSAGHRVMHMLADYLQKCGVESRVAILVPAGAKHTITDDIKQYFLDNINDVIVVQLESVYGNFMRAPRLVRYVAYEPGRSKNVPKTLDPNELTIVYSDDLRASTAKAVGHPIDEDHVIRIESIDPGLFYNCGKPEIMTNECIYLGKARHKAPLIIPAYPEGTGCVRMITPEDPPTREKTAWLLRRTKTLFLMDDYSAIGKEALMCGCKVLVPGKFPDHDKWVDYPMPPHEDKYVYGDLEPVQRLIRLCREKWSV